MLGTFVAGAYTGTYQIPSGSAIALGLTQEGYRLRWTYSTDNIEATDAYGQGTLIEMFYQGINVWISGIFKEYKTQPLASTAPWNALPATGAGTLNLGIVGRVASAVGGQLVLTSTAGTPAASSPATLTAPVVIQDTGAQVEVLLGPTHRTTPFNYRVIPTLVSTDIRYFTTT